MAAKLVRVSSKGQFVLPKRLRDKMGIEEGDYVYVGELSDGVVILSTSTAGLLDAILEPLRRAAEAQGYTREDLEKAIQEVRAERRQPPTK